MDFDRVRNACQRERTERREKRERDGIQTCKWQLKVHARAAREGESDRERGESRVILEYLTKCR